MEFIHFAAAYLAAGIATTLFTIKRNGYGGLLMHPITFTLYVVIFPYAIYEGAKDIIITWWLRITTWWLRRRSLKK